MITIFSRFTFWLALAGFVALGLFVRANTSVSAMPEPPSPPPAKPFTAGIGASGILEASRENTNIGVPVAGLVKQVNVSVWQKVRAGDVLLQLDDREIKTQFTTQRAELALRHAEWHRARRQYDRLAKMGLGPAFSREDLEKREDDLSVAEAMVAKAKSAIATTEELLARFTVTAPIDGTVLQVNVRAGEYAAPGASSPPMIIGSLDTLQVRADVDEQLAPRVKNGARAVAYRKGETSGAITLSFVRIEPFIIPKKSLTGSGSERVDTRVLPVIFSFANTENLKTYVGQQVDIFIEEAGLP